MRLQGEETATATASGAVAEMRIPSVGEVLSVGLGLVCERFRE